MARTNTIPRGVEDAEREPHTTTTCVVCNHPGTVWVRPDDVTAWEAGTMAQDAFPYLGRDDREQLVTGTHPDCWDRLFDPEHDQ